MWQKFIDIETIEEYSKSVIPNIVVKEERGMPDGTHCTIDEFGNPILYWDSLMYEFFDKQLTLLDSFPYIEKDDEKLILEMKYNYVGVLFDHLSEKYRKHSYISSALKRKANEFNYPYFEYVHDRLPEYSEMNVQYCIQSYIFSLLIVFHEVAHCLFSLDDSEKKKLENHVVENLTLLNKNSFDYSVFIKDKNIMKDVTLLIDEICSSSTNNQSILEELAADTYALSKTYSTCLDLFHTISSENISDHVMVSYLRYLDISSQYGYIVDYWDEIYNYYNIQKKKTDTDYQYTLKRKNALTTIRSTVWGIVSMINIIQFDVLRWNYSAPKGISLADPRIRRCTEIYGENLRYLSGAINAIISTKLFNNIIDEARRLEDAGNSEVYNYPPIPDNAVIRTWLAAQLYTYIGIQKKEENDYENAIKEFIIACMISEHYLGHQHRLTAKAYSNICSGYLGEIINYKRCNPNYLDSPYFQECYNLALYNSSIAIDILNEIEETEVYQAGPIYNNAGDVLLAVNKFDEALKYYIIAQKIKADNTDGYLLTNAITDYHMAIAYFHLHRFLDAKKSCMKALSYMRSNHENSALLNEIEDFYNNILSMMDTSQNALEEIFSSLINGKTVNLDQYMDLDEINNLYND